MKAKLILINKEDNKYPIIDIKRPICVQSAITKIFESSIKHYLDAIMDRENIFDDNQKGLRKQRSIQENISDVLDIAIKMKYSEKEKPHLVFSI